MAQRQHHPSYIPGTEAESFSTARNVKQWVRFTRFGEPFLAQVYERLAPDGSPVLEVLFGTYKDGKRVIDKAVFKQNEGRLVARFLVSMGFLPYEY